jgi:glycosyltransferase involved in cell wall biosynthesis
MPAHNAELTISKSIKSILSQSRPAYEIIVILDACTDSTLELLNEFKEQNITVYEVNFKNSAKSRNYGASKSLTPFVAFLDSDDTWEPNKIFLQLKQFSNFNGISGTNSLFENAYGVVLGRNVVTKNDDEATAMVRNGIALPAMLSTWVIPRELFFTLNGFNENIPAAEDFDFAVRAANQGVRFTILRKDLSHYLIHSNSKSVTNRSVQKRMGKLIKLSNGRVISTEQISQTLERNIGIAESLSVYSDLYLRKFMVTAKINFFHRRYHLLLLSFLLNPGNANLGWSIICSRLSH